MTDHLESRKVICLLDANAECNRIWISERDGLHLAHFQTPRREPQGERRQPVLVVALSHASDATAYNQCARHCLPGGGHYQSALTRSQQ
jgi:hypothetical protein